MWKSRTLPVFYIKGLNYLRPFFLFLIYLFITISRHNFITIMNILLRYISFVISIFILFPALVKAECDICNFTVEEVRFNTNIVGYYMAGFDISTGNSNVDLFEYLINGPSECYYSSSGDEKLELRFKIEIFSPELGYDVQETFVEGSLLLSDFYWSSPFKKYRY